jgi:thiosulfate/3-mercaptopyruvate sulfurtransferase
MTPRNTIAGLLISALITAVPDVGFAASACGEQRITPGQLDQALSDGVDTGLLLFDTRSRQSFLTGTIPGAVGAGILQERIDGTHEDRQGTLFVIVTEEGLADSALQDWIKRLCDRKIDTYVLDGGIKGWRAQGFELEDPAQRLTLPGTVPFVIPRGLCEMNEPVQEYN